MDDIYLLTCTGCRKRTPVRYMVAIQGARYCERCGMELARLMRTQAQDIRRISIKREPEKAPPDRQRERNKGKPDVMQARIPERRLWPKGD